MKYSKRGARLTYSERGWVLRDNFDDAFLRSYPSNRIIVFSTRRDARAFAHSNNLVGLHRVEKAMVSV